LGNIRRLLWYLFLLFLLLALIRGCHCNTDYCAERDRLALEKKKEEALRDSIREEYKKNLDQALSSIAIIYFYRNSDEINLNSLGNNSPIERLYKVIDAYDEYNFVIEGHHSGLSVESKPNLDIMRAETLRSKLIDMGIDKKRLSSLGKGDKELLDSSGKLSTFYVSPGTVKEYNRNMRARVKYVLKP
jgi:outer membrane protein OmpA-like peptidoglycan-associated protein